MSCSIYPCYHTVCYGIILENVGNLPCQIYELNWELVRFVVEKLKDGSYFLKLRVETLTQTLLTSIF